MNKSSKQIAPAALAAVAAVIVKGGNFAAIRSEMNANGLSRYSVPTVLAQIAQLR